MDDGKVVATIDYTNWRGERSLRRVIPSKIVWAYSEWHPQEQWILLAWDCDKSADREFALQSIHSWTPPKAEDMTEPVHTFTEAQLAARDAAKGENMSIDGTGRSVSDIAIDMAREHVSKLENLLKTNSATEPTHTFTTEQLAARDSAVTAKALQMAADKCEELAHSLSDENKISEELTARVCHRRILALQPAPTRWQEVPEGGIDEKLKASGMLTVEQCLQSASKFQVTVGMTTPEFFEQWLERKAREYIAIHARYEVGDKQKDELYEWVLAHMGAFKEVLVNYRAMTGAQEV